MRIETQIHKMETRHEILSEQKQHHHNKDSEEDYESEQLSRSAEGKSFEHNQYDDVQRDQQIFEDNEAEEITVQRPKKPTIE